MLESNTSIKVLVIHVVTDGGESIKTKVLSVGGGAHKLSQGFLVRLDDFIMWTLIIKINGYKPVYPQMEDGRYLYTYNLKLIWQSAKSSV